MISSNRASTSARSTASSPRRVWRTTCPRPSRREPTSRRGLAHRVHRRASGRLSRRQEILIEVHEDDDATSTYSLPGRFRPDDDTLERRRRIERRRDLTDRLIELRGDVTSERGDADSHSFEFRRSALSTEPRPHARASRRRRALAHLFFRLATRRASGQLATTRTHAAVDRCRVAGE